MWCVAEKHQVLVGGFPQTIDDLGCVKTYAAVAGGQKLSHTALAQRHDLLRQLHFQFLAAVIGKLLLPVLEIYFCFAACACVWGSRAVEEAAALFSKCLHWLLKVCGAVFSFVLGLQSVLAGTADSAALRTGKSVLQGAVPVVGDAAAAALTGAAAAVQLLKGSLALAALLALGASSAVVGLVANGVGSG